MCGRFAITLPADAMASLFEAVPANDLPEVPNYNVCPTNRIHAVVSEGGTRRLTAMRWGLIPHWYKAPNDGPLLINARSETVAEKPAFAKSIRERRCLIPASGFYEWTKGEDDKRLPWFIFPKGEGPIVFAGLWREWGGDDDRMATCAILTTAANEAMSALHHRQPVQIEKGDFGLWLGEEGKGAARLMKAPPEDALKWHRVDRKVNSNRARGAELIEPLES